MVFLFFCNFGYKCRIYKTSLRTSVCVLMIVAVLDHVSIFKKFYSLTTLINENIFTKPILNNSLLVLNKKMESFQFFFKLLIIGLYGIPEYLFTDVLSKSQNVQR